MKRENLFISILIALIYFSSCTEDNTIQGDTYLPGDIIITDISKDTISDTRSDTSVTDIKSDITDDVQTCNLECPANMHCENSGCVCDEHFEDCNSDKSDGCETDLTQLQTCGGCNIDCSKPTLGTLEYKCVDMQCVVERCKEGRADCNGKGNDGCEVYLTDDPENCSKCGFDCGAHSICENSTCKCESGYANCNLLLDDGCEQNISSDSENCGACENSCGPNSLCSNQKCLCLDGFEDCNASKTDGCETRINEDEHHCGGCKNDCTKLNNVQSVKCDSGSCVIIDCKLGYGDCNNYNPDGCEADFSSDPEHCGDCSTKCGNNSICDNKTCACQQDYANCNGLWSDGCDIYLNDDKTCGSDCNNLINCGPNAKCSNHQCGCITPFADCNNTFDDGCEIDTANDRENCGRCKKNAGRSITAGVV